MSIERLKPAHFFDEERLAALRSLVPEAFADGKVNWSTLKDALGGELEDSEEDAEHFGLSWPGKREARRLAGKPSTGTLVPARGEGIDEDTTKNIYIEGENLEVLKLLRKSYSGQVKMIYIDPPYNTGNDFVYDDDFAEPLQDYLRRTGQIDGEGKPTTTNKKADGRFHSKWLSMMYPRLRLARELLRDDGVIFVSIDDNEVHHLRMLMNEVFGEENFVASFIWNTEGHTDNQFDAKINHEYILLYTKSSDFLKLEYVIDPNTRSESNLWKGYAENSITKNGPKNPPSSIELPIGFPCVVDSISIKKTDVPSQFYESVKKTGYISRQITELYGVSYPIKQNDMVVTDGKLVSPCNVYAGWANADKLRSFIENNCNPLLESDGIVNFFLSENGVIYYRKEREKARNILSVLRNFSTTERMRSELETTYGISFQYPKPKELIKYLITIGANDGIVLDFFAGSGTTAHAVIDEISGGKRLQFILVQLDQKLSDNISDQVSGYQFCLENGFPTNISSITKERIRRVIGKIRDEKAGELEGVGEMDLGFKVFKLAKSHFKPWENYHGESIERIEELFAEFVTPLVPTWRQIENGLLTEILLLEGFPLDSTITTLADYAENAVVEVSSTFHQHRLVVCLDDQLSAGTVKTLSLRENDTFICLDSAVDSQTKTRLADKGQIKTI